MDRLSKLMAQASKAEQEVAAAEKKKALALEKLRKEQTALETRMNILVGGVVRQRMEEDEAFRDVILSLLEKGLTKPRERELFGLEVIDTNHI